MWALWTVLAAILESFAVLFRKQATIGLRDYRLLPLLTVTLALPLTTSLAFYSLQEAEYIDLYSIIWLLALSIILNIIAIIFRYKALKLADISLLEPLTILTTVFLVGTSFVMLGEKPPANGLAGVLTISLGALLVSYQLEHKGVKSKLKNSKNRKGVMFLLVTVACWSITTNLDKLVVNELPIPVYVWLLHQGITVGLLIVYRPKLHEIKKVLFKKWPLIAWVGFLTSGALLLQTLAITEAFVSYMSALRNVSVLIAVILGGVFLHEKNVKRRAFGSIIMLIGVLLLSL